MTDASEDREMVEVMARSLCADVCRVPCVNDGGCIAWDLYVPTARKHITALREAGYTVTRSGNGIVHRQEVFKGETE